MEPERSLSSYSTLPDRNSSESPDGKHTFTTDIQMPFSKLGRSTGRATFTGGVTPLLLLAFSSLLLGGCLMVESKDYTFLVKPDGSGSGRIVFENFTSMQDTQEAEDQTTKDYTELINKFLKGNSLEMQNPAYTNLKKRLFEQDGKLHGEITFDFASYEDVGLFRLDDKGMWMYHAGQMNGGTMERLDSANGRFGGQRMPVVFWPEGTSEFRLYTTLEQPEENAVTRSLLPLFKRIGTD
jgi:hypothetical protein